MSLRQMSDGHVMTLTSVEGHMIRLIVRNGQAVLSLSEPVGGSGSGIGLGLPVEPSELAGPDLIEGEFTSVVSQLAI